MPIGRPAPDKKPWLPHAVLGLLCRSDQDLSLRGQLELEHGTFRYVR